MRYQCDGKIVASNAVGGVTYWLGSGGGVNAQVLQFTPSFKNFCHDLCK